MKERRPEVRRQLALFPTATPKVVLTESWSAEVQAELIGALVELLLAGIGDRRAAAAREGGRDERQSHG
jgi:hypothetical protein